jgi:hypothetical protein
MLNLPQHEELLRADLRIAENSLDATREAIANNQMTNEEGDLILAAALSRYAAALLRFSRLVLDGEVPPDLEERRYLAAGTRRRGTRRADR